MPHLTPVSAHGTPVPLPSEWPVLSQTQFYEITLVPVGFFVAFIVLFYFWPVYELKKDEEQAVNGKKATEGTRLLLPGDTAGDYSEDWKSTFDLVLAIFMFACLAILVLWTSFFKPQLWSNSAFWIAQLPKPICMMGVGLLCGLLCRYMCGVDESGYTLGGKHKWFKVNYTRKVQHFAAYLIPLIVKLPEDCHGPLETAWGQWVTLICFALLIKPIRENSSFFMLQFNSMDRPEDRPHTLKWIVGGNILPGTACILFFRTLYHPTAQEDLALIFIFVTGLGDGLAEPVGIWLGRHKYKARSCTDKTLYTRSYEGSACVFMSGLIFTSTTWYAFHNPLQFWICFFLMGPCMTLAEAFSPHTLDTPFIMCTGGFIIYILILTCNGPP